MAQGYTGGNVTPPGTGQLLQSQFTQDSALDSSTTAMPLDDTIPQNTEGEEYTALSTTITPSSASNILEIELLLWVDHSAGNDSVAAIFQDSTAGALAAGYDKNNTSFGGNQVVIKFKKTAGTTSAITFKVRYGPKTASGTTYVNGSSAGSRLLGGVYYSSLSVKEIKA
jgi:hypothetical protein